MKTALRSMRIRQALPALALAAALLAARPAAAQIRGELVTTADRHFVGNITWRAGDKAFQVSGDSGGAVPIPLNQVASVTVAPPANLSSSAPVAVLEKIVDDYLMLGPDLTAMRLLAEAQQKSGQSADAAKRFVRVLENRSPASVPADVMRKYWDVLLATDNLTELNKSLTRTIAEGSRPAQAVAQMLRGDMNVRRKQYRDALLDGYLRTIVLFSDIREPQPEALSKAAKCFQELGETHNVEIMRKKLASEFPDSPYSKDAPAGT